MLPELFKRVKPLFGKLIDVLWIEYQTADPKRKSEIEELLTLLTVKYIGVTVGEQRVLLEPPAPLVIGQGDYYVGNVIYPSIKAFPFKVSRDELLRHIFILGPTGTGKSTLILGFLVQFLRDSMPFMVFDFKRNYRCLLRAEGAGLLVFTVGRETAPLRMNVLQPPVGISGEEWIEALADIIGVAYILMQGARNVLKEALVQAYRVKKKEASLYDAYKFLDIWLRTCRGGSRKYGWIESAARSVEELCKGGYGMALNATNGLTMEALLEYPVVFELEGLGVDQKRFFCLYCLQSILLIRKKQEVERERLRHVLVFDESHHVFPRQKQGVLDVPSILAREVREYGEAIIAAAQQADVSESLIANAGFKFILRCDYPDDVTFASRLMQLEPKWFPCLPVGFSIVRIPVRHYMPFLLAFKKQRIKNEWVGDGMVGRAWKEHALTVRLDAATWVASVEKRLGEKERCFLQDVLDHPASTTTERYRRLGLNSKVGNAVKDRLTADGLVLGRDIKTGKGKVKLLGLTNEGVFLMRGYDARKPDGRAGGGVHEYWRNELRKMLQERGYTVKAEYALGEGRAVDLRGERGGAVVWVEVETGRSDVGASIAKLGGVEGVRVLFFTDDALVEKSAAPPGVQVLSPATLASLSGLL